MKQRKKLRGFTLITTIISILALLIMFVGGVYLGSKVVRDYRTEAIMRECSVIDAALRTYSLSHVGIQKDTVTYVPYSTNVPYTGDRSYPASLHDLGVVRDEQAYFAKDIDLSKFDYSVGKDPDTGLTVYTLGVHLPNGYYYTSPQSGK